MYYIKTKYFLFLSFFINNICQGVIEQTAPSSITEINSLVLDAACNKKYIIIKGAGNGISCKITQSDKNAIIIDFKNFNKVIELNFIKKTITVESGITWKDIQKIISPYGLAITAMQSYADFSVGGSIGVNAHGQDFKYAPIGTTILSMNIMKANGTIVTVSPTENTELFHAVIGGYGLFGIILDVTLQLTDNTKLLKEVALTSLSDGIALGKKYLDSATDIGLYSARLNVEKGHLFETLLTATYVNTNIIVKENMKEDNSISVRFKNYSLKYLFYFLKKDSLKTIRSKLEKFITANWDPETTRNQAMSWSIKTLENVNSSYLEILQEYFLPIDQMELFIQKAKIITQKYNINIINGTLRFVKKNSTGLLNYASEDVYALVFYFSIDNNPVSMMYAQIWTRELINAAIECQGKFYLPYQCFATKQQVQKAYPNFEDVITLKKIYDPQEIFVNDLYLKYNN